MYFPEAADVEEFVAAKGMNGFYESVENRKDCCYIRKVKPLNRALKGARYGLPVYVRINPTTGNICQWWNGRGESNFIKFNPLINWSYDEVMDYINENQCAI